MIQKSSKFPCHPCLSIKAGMRVYLSSTLKDLGPERQAIKDALSGECAVVESYTADERSVRDSCLADVASCDVYIGIVGRRYGFIPPGASHSITVLEYEKARKEDRFLSLSNVIRQFLLNLLIRMKS